jgi:hypothetical protein
MPRRLAAVATIFPGGLATALHLPLSYRDHWASGLRAFWGPHFSRHPLPKHHSQELRFGLGFGERLDDPPTSAVRSLRHREGVVSEAPFSLVC